LILIFQILSFKQFINPAQVTSKHKHRCCPCPKWADLIYSLILDYLLGLDERADFCTT